MYFFPFPFLLFCTYFSFCHLRRFLGAEGKGAPHHDDIVPYGYGVALWRSVRRGRDAVGTCKITTAVVAMALRAACNRINITDNTAHPYFHFLQSKKEIFAGSKYTEADLSFVERAQPQVTKVLC